MIASATGILRKRIAKPFLPQRRMAKGLSNIRPSEIGSPGVLELAIHKNHNHLRHLKVPHPDCLPQ
jgi:hypothetical protein